MSAVTLLCQLLEKNDLLFAPHDCYGGTHSSYTFFKEDFKLEFHDQTNDALNIIKSKPKIIWLETPSNPLLES